MGEQLHGSFLWPDGSQYTGTFNAYCMEGSGTLLLDNEVISGEWKDSKLHGEGERKFSDGQFYRGKWTFGKLNGYGSYETLTEKYDGYFVNNMENGKGKKVSRSEGFVYEGEFKDGYFDGVGRQKFITTGDLFEGQFVQGKREGNGVLNF